MEVGKRVLIKRFMSRLEDPYEWAISKGACCGIEQYNGLSKDEQIALLEHTERDMHWVFGRIDFYEGIDLGGLVFERVDFRRVRFENCDLSGVVFDNCQFNCTVFEGCNLLEATFEGCNLLEVEFKECNHEKASFFDNYYMESCKFTRSEAAEADVAEADVSDADVSEKEVVMENRTLLKALMAGAVARKEEMEQERLLRAVTLEKFLGFNCGWDGLLEDNRPFKVGFLGLEIREITPISFDITEEDSVDFCRFYVNKSNTHAIDWLVNTLLNTYAIYYIIDQVKEKEEIKF